MMKPVSKDEIAGLARSLQRHSCDDEAMRMALVMIAGAGVYLAQTYGVHAAHDALQRQADVYAGKLQ